MILEVLRLNHRGKKHSNRFRAKELLDRFEFDCNQPNFRQK
jgi:hypothetical protein